MRGSQSRAGAVLGTPLPQSSVLRAHTLGWGVLARVRAVTAARCGVAESTGAARPGGRCWGGQPAQRLVRGGVGCGLGQKHLLEA